MEISNIRSGASRTVSDADTSVPIRQRSNTGSALVPPLPPPSAGYASPRETLATLAHLSDEISGALDSSDPEVLLTVIAGRMSQVQQTTTRASVDASDSTRKHEQAARIDAFHRAADAESSQQTWGLLGKIGCYVAAAAAIVGGILGAVYSGGTSVVGAIVLAVVLISAAASITCMALKDSGAVSEIPAGVTIAVDALEVAGAVCSMGAGSGSLFSAAADVATLTADVGVATGSWQEPAPQVRIAILGVGMWGAMESAGLGTGGGGSGAESAATMVKATGETVGAVGKAGTAVTGFEATEAHLDAKRHAQAAERASDTITELVDGLRAAMRVHANMVRNAVSMATERNTARMDISRNFARA